MKTITVKVTQEHIGAGVAESCRSCPVALALQDAGYPRAVVANFIFLDAHDPDSRLLRTPASVVRFVHRFDSGQTVEPFEFQLEVPE